MMRQSPTIKSVNARLAEELAVEEAQVAAAVRLLDEGATVPFIARYRKEVDRQSRRRPAAHARGAPGLSAGTRRTPGRGAGLHRGAGQAHRRAGAALMAADTKARVEDIYLPYKPKRRTKAQIAREAGLEPLADRLLADPTLDPEEAAAAFLGDGRRRRRRGARRARGTSSSSGAAEDAELVGAVREKFWADGSLRTAAMVGGRGKSAGSTEVPRLLRVRRTAGEDALTPGARRHAWRERRSPCRSPSTAVTTRSTRP